MVNSNPYQKSPLATFRGTKVCNKRMPEEATPSARTALLVVRLEGKIRQRLPTVNASATAGAENLSSRGVSYHVILSHVRKTASAMTLLSGFNSHLSKQLTSSLRGPLVSVPCSTQEPDTSLRVAQFMLVYNISSSLAPSVRKGWSASTTYL